MRQHFTTLLIVFAVCFVFRGVGLAGFSVTLVFVAAFMQVRLVGKFPIAGIVLVVEFPSTCLPVLSRQASEYSAHIGFLGVLDSVGAVHGALSTARDSV